MRGHKNWITGKEVTGKTTPKRAAGLVVLICLFFIDYFFTRYLGTLLVPLWGVETWKLIGKTIFMVLGVGIGVPLMLLTYKIMDKMKESFQRRGLYFGEPPEDTSGEWKCPKCGKTNPDTSFKCSKCGYSVV